MDVTLDIITEQIIVIDVIEQAATEITVVVGSSGNDGVGVIPGGTTGQVLSKASNANFDTAWQDPAAGTVASVNGKSGIVTLNQDDVGDGTTHKQYTATEKTKLSGVATGATANDTDVNLKARANHTGSQAISTVTGLQAAIDAKAPLASPAFTGTPTGITKTHVGLGNVDNTSDIGKSISTATQTALDAKASTSSVSAHIADTANPHVVTKTQVGLGNVDNTTDAGKPVSTATQTALDLKASSSHTHTSSQVTDFATAVDARIQNVVGAAPAALDTLDELAAALGDDANFAATMTTSLAGKSNTGHTHTKSEAGLANVDNTSDVNKPVSTAQQTALDGKQTLDSDLTSIAALTPSNDDIIQRKAGVWTNRTAAQVKTDLELTKSDVGLSNVDNVSDANKPISTAEQTALNLKANIASPTFTGTVGGVTKSMVGLGSVDNTADTAKPVSTAQQTALDLKAPLASPAFTGTPTGITKSHVGLGSVDNTADTAKPVSTAQQTALDLKAPLASPAFTGTPTGITKTHVGLGSVDNTADTAKPVSTAQQTALDARFVYADGTTVSNARPSTSSKCIWVGGTTQPTNMTTGDLWIKA